MTFSDRDIKDALQYGDIKIVPEPDLSTQLGSCSIDLRLGNEFRVFNHNSHYILDPSGQTDSRETTRLVTVNDGESFIIHPGDFVLAVTLETITISPKLMGRLEGRSSLARMGVIVHSTAGIFDAGWDGKPVLELGNLGKMPVRLTPGMRICAMAFEELKNPAIRPYTKKENAKYAIQNNPVESKFYMDISSVSINEETELEEVLSTETNLPESEVKYPEEIKTKVIKSILRGNSFAEDIAEEYGIPLSVIKGWVLEVEEILPTLFNPAQIKDAEAIASLHRARKIRDLFIGNE